MAFETERDGGLDDLELDALTELVNIGVGRGALSLRQLVGEQVLLSVPSLAILSRGEAIQALGPDASSLLVAVRQGFSGAFSGQALLIFPEISSLELVRAVAGRQLALDDIVELEHEALAEIGNIILNGCIGTIANLMRKTLSMSLPEIIKGTSREFIDLFSGGDDDVVLVVRINFRLKGHEISGHVAMVMDLQSLAALKRLIGEFIRRETIRLPGVEE